MMRQAGRYLPEYRRLRQTAGSFLNLCYNPEMACEVTLQPLRRFDLDAAILFSDILVVPHALGLSLDFREGEGPVLATVRNLREVHDLVVDDTAWQFLKVWQTVGLVREALTPDIALIGFCGAPWTVASYMIEGGSSDRKQALAVARENPDWFQLLISKIVKASIGYLIGQIKAGAEAVQIFDSWAGDLPFDQLERLVCMPIREIVDGVRLEFPDFPIIVFARGVGDRHGSIAAGTEANAVGIEENVKLATVLSHLGAAVAVQGNISPSVLLGSAEDLAVAVKNTLVGVPKKRHIFNLGHGVVPQTDPAMVERLVAEVRRFDAGLL